MNRMRFSVMAIALSLTVLTSAHAGTALSQSTASTVSEVNVPTLNNSGHQLFSFIEALAAEHFSSAKLEVRAVDVDFFAGPYSMFVSKPAKSLADTSAGSMMLASLGLMALIARRRMTL
jgi:hypothetical protein